MHGNQSISKTITWHGKQPLTKVTTRLEQYWNLNKFLDTKSTDFCSEHCPLRPGVPVVARTQHLPLTRAASDRGVYRSKQVYYMGNGHSSDEKIGCIDMRFEYCEEDAAGSCRRDAVASASAEHPRPEDGSDALMAAKEDQEELLMPADAEKDSKRDGKPGAPCCEVCHAPRSKYYSVVTSESNEGFCGEACMLPALYPIFKVFESNLTLAASRDAHACASQLSSHGRHFTVYNSTVTHGVPGLSITLDLYAPGASV